MHALFYADIIDIKYLQQHALIFFKQPQEKKM